MQVLDDIQKTVFKVSDFLEWQRQGRLILSPSFQRRSVWKKGPKSYLIDTIVRGLPVPIVFLRERIDLDNQSAIREVVDGQQRLRTLFSFIDESSLKDFSPDRDRFTVRKSHNAEIGGKRFDALPADTRRRILGYTFSTHVLPSDTDDRQVLQIFARMNSTGVRVSRQELRNALFFGPFKQAMYELGYEQLERWRTWRIFSEDQLARMKEVELVSDLVSNMMNGVSGKTQTILDSIYRQYNKQFPGNAVVSQRFRVIMDRIEDLLGTSIQNSAYSSEVHFYTLFTALYDMAWGLGTPLKRQAAKKFRAGLASRLRDVGERLSAGSVPADVLDAIQRASADPGRRQKRLDFLREACDG